MSDKVPPNQIRFTEQIPDNDHEPIHQRKPRAQPLADPADERAARFGMRLHPDLRAELERMARQEGYRLSQPIERLLVDGVNRAAGRDILDRIGRYRT